jgi:hypothetical protein
MHNVDVEPSLNGLMAEPNLVGHLKTVCLLPSPTCIQLMSVIQILGNMHNWTAPFDGLCRKKPTSQHVPFNRVANSSGDSLTSTATLLDIFEQSVIHSQASHWHKVVANFALAAFILGWNCEVSSHNTIQKSL